MNRKFQVLFLVLSITACSTKDKYDVSRYYDAPEQDKLLTGIVTYVFDAPPMTLLKDRFQPKHRNYYSFVASRFSILEYYKGDNGRDYFFLMRPGPSAGEKRGVGGYLKIDSDMKITDFREMFVTPLLTAEEVKKRGAFLFDEMVKGQLAKYLQMESYVQWPNPATYYDSIEYQWKLKPELNQ